jgi:hypothetical protein
MNDQALLWLCLLFSGLSLIAVVVLSLRFKGAASSPRSPFGDPTGTLIHQQQKADEFDVIPAESFALDSAILDLSFEESLDGEKYALASRNAAMRGLAVALADRLGDGIQVAVNSVTLGKSAVTMTVAVSKEGRALMEKGVATLARHQSGKLLPQIRDAKTGKLLETMKEAGGAKALARTAAVSAAIVGAAHIISGADIAKRLKEVDAKINLLLAYRRIDQMATLERIYTSARELLSGAATSEQARWELWRLRGELRELRTRWRRELKHHLELVEDPKEAGWYLKMFGWIDAVDRIPHKDTHAKITEGQIHIAMIEYSLRLDHALAVASGTVDAFERTLAGELTELDSVSQLLSRKGHRIKFRYRDLSADPTCAAMEAVVTEYRKVLPDFEGVNAELKLE